MSVLSVVVDTCMKFTRMALSDVPVEEKNVEITKITNASVETIKSEMQIKTKILKLRIENFLYEEFCRNKLCEGCSMNIPLEDVRLLTCSMLTIQKKVSDIIDKEIDTWK